jgi:DNA-binding CsgD family transcriptional regulator
VLLERDGELALLAGLLDGVSSAGGRLVLIRGEAGIGKSALVRALVERLSASAQVHVGVCDDLHTPRPFGPLWDIAADERSLKEGLEQRDRQHVFEALMGLLGRPCSNVVVIEDVQWSDEATLDAMRYVGRRIGSTNGLVLLTYRDGEVDVDHPLRMVIGDLPPQHVVRIELAPLSLAAVAIIVGDSGRDPARVLHATGGNPFLITELVTAPGDDVPASVRDSVMGRLARLSASAREMLTMLSVIPDRVGADEVALVTSAGSDELAECERQGLLEIGDGSVCFRHGLLRQAIESSLTISEQVAIHRSLLERLPSTTDPARMVHHARAANDVARLVEFGPTAARAAAAVRSHREAVAHFQALNPYLDRLPVKQRAAHLADWARTEYYLGHAESATIIDRAIRMYEQSGSTVGLGLALALAMEILGEFGEPEVAVERGKAAVDALRSGGPSAELATTLAHYAMLLLRVGKGRGAELVADEAVAAAEEAKDSAAAVMAINVKGTLAYVRRDPDSLELFERARRLAHEADHYFDEVHVLLTMAFVTVECRDLDRAAEFARRSFEAAVRYELPMLEAWAVAVHAEVLLWNGGWASAEDLATEALGSWQADSRLCSIVGMLRTRSGRSGGQAHLERAWSLASSRVDIDGRLRAASALAESIWLGVQHDHHLLDEFAAVLDEGIAKEYPWPAGQLAFWLWMLGTISTAPPGIAEPYEAVIDGDSGRAADAWQTRKAPYERALALLSGDPAQRLEALELLETLGATVVAAKVRKQLRHDGIAAPRGRGRATRSHVAGLTARQAEVLYLLDEGLTNSEIADRLFVSPRTVENHVSAVLAKLDTSSRDEAVLRARHDGLLVEHARA